MSWLRVFLPSWRFFADVDEIPQLCFRWKEAGGELGSWRSARLPERRTLGTLFLNARGNLNLALGSAVERLWDEMSERPAPGAAEPARSVTYRLIDAWVRRRVVELAPRATAYQFKISLDPSGEDVMISPVHELKPGEP